jgi:hypothetical protein
MPTSFAIIDGSASSSRMTVAAGNASAPKRSAGDNRTSGIAPQASSFALSTSCATSAASTATSSRNVTFSRSSSTAA